MTFVVGITGGIASGKSTVMNIIKEKGYKVISCDDISNKVLQDKRKNVGGFSRVVEAFGEAIVVENEIDRKALGKIVFNDFEKRKQLESILHPLIRKRLEDIIKKEKENILFVEIPLLFETDFYQLCDKTIVVYVDLDNQAWRLMARNKIEFPEALKLIYLQMPMDQKIKRADFVIDNTHGIYDINWQVNQIIAALEEARK